VRLACNVADAATGAAVADASFTYEAGAAQFSTQTDAQGSCELILPASEVVGVDYPAASVSKVGYEPQTVLYRQLEAGKSYTQDVLLTPLATSVSIPTGGDTVWHLGDDQFDGTVNSQFQKKSDGPQLVFVIADWAAKVQAGYTRATVYLDAKGWQSNLCQNLIGLAGDVGYVTLPGGNSPADGYWGGGKQVPFEFAIAQVGSQSAELRVTSGSCGGSTDLDDFEINRIRVYFD